MSQHLDSLGRDGQVPIRTTRVTQTTETEVTFVAAPGANVRYAYARSSDSVANQIEGQDYLIFRHNDQRFVFVVCDGVGSSFCGNLAARILGEGLLDWLWTLDIAYVGGPDALAEAATGFLRRLQADAQREVSGYEIPDHLPLLVRQALEQQRDYGSEAIFAAARIDYPSPMTPEGLLTLCWMGDTQLHIQNEEGDHLDIGAEWSSTNRWSTAQGVKGNLSARMSKLKGIGRLLAFTDGLNAHAGRLARYSDAEIERAIYAGARAATSDDVAFIDVILRTLRYEGYPDGVNKGSGSEMECPSLEPIWNPTNSDRYELRWGWTGGGGARFIVQEAGDPAFSQAQTYEVPPKELTWRPPKQPAPGRYYYRVRAIGRRGVVGPWSELRHTRVAHPPPPAPRLGPIVPASTGTGVAVAWSDVGDVFEYILEEATRPDFSDVRPVYRGRNTSWSTTEVYQPGTYYYRVQASSDGGPGPWSVPESVELTIPPPPTPHLGDVFYGSVHGDYTLRWTDVQSAETYELEERNIATGDVRTVTLEETFYHVKGQAVGEYVYHVRASHAYGSSAWSNDQVAVIAPLPPSQVPTLTAEGPDPQRRVILTWTPIPEAERYVIAVSEEGDFRYAREYEETTTTLTLPRREPGELYCRVCGANAGGEGPWSDIVCVLIPPRAPAWIEAQLLPGSQRVEVSWGEVGEQVTYRLEMLPPDGTDTADGELLYQGRDTHHSAPAPGNLEEAIFRIRAEAGAGYSPWQYSDVVQVRSAPPVPKLEAPSVNEVGEVLLRWQPVADADVYIVECAQDRGFIDARRFEHDKPGATFRPSVGGKYWFRVQACRGKRCSETSNVVSISVQGAAAPKLWTLDPVKVGSTYEVAWSGVPGCRSYELQESIDSTFARSNVTTFYIAHPEQKYTIANRGKGHYYYRVRAVDSNDHPGVWSTLLIVEVVE